MENDTIHIVRAEKCSIGNITLRNDKILMCKPFDHITTCNVKELEEMYDIFIDMTGGVPHLFYSDNSNLKKFGSEERVYVSSKFHHFASVCAIKENSAFVRFVTSYIKYLHKPKIDMKMFKNEVDAIEWLKSL